MMMPGLEHCSTCNGKGKFVKTGYMITMCTVCKGGGVVPKKPGHGKLHLGALSLDSSSASLSDVSPGDEGDGGSSSSDDDDSEQVKQDKNKRMRGRPKGNKHKSKVDWLVV